MCAATVVGLPGAVALGAKSSTMSPYTPTARRLLGAAIRPDQLTCNSPLLDIIVSDCGILVPEYHGQWSAFEWQRGNPWYGNYDTITDFAAEHDKQVRGHALLWGNMTPDWAREAIDKHRDWRAVELHFASLLPRYRGRIVEWIVVNEMIDTEDGDDGMRRTVFQRGFGTTYIRRALETARTLDPDAQLMINDYGLSHDNPVDEARRSQMLRLVERLKHDGAPLDIVGIQGHLELAKGPVAQRQIARFMTDLAGMGVRIAITELDVLEADRRQPIDHRDAQVAGAVHALLDVALDQPAVTSVVTWGLSDHHSWLQKRAPETEAACARSPIDCSQLNRGLPYDGAMSAKPMHAALARVPIT